MSGYFTPVSETGTVTEPPAADVIVTSAGVPSCRDEHAAGAMSPYGR